MIRVDGSGSRPAVSCDHNQCGASHWQRDVVRPSCGASQIGCGAPAFSTTGYCRISFALGVFDAPVVDPQGSVGGAECEWQFRSGMLRRPRLRACAAPCRTAACSTVGSVIIIFMIIYKQ